MELTDTSEEYRLEAREGVGVGGSQEREDAEHVCWVGTCGVGTRYMARIGAWQRGLERSNRADPWSMCVC